MQIKKVTSKAAILKLMDNRLKALHDKDINALLSNHTPDIRSFDVIDPQPYIGADTVIARDMDDIINLSSMRLCLILKASLKLYLSNKYQLLKWEISHFIVNKF